MIRRQADQGYSFVDCDLPPFDHSLDERICFGAARDVAGLHNKVSAPAERDYCQ